ncbi:hypothetical protein [Glycomyces rhizosphaerae]|uniref:Immunity protein Imm1 n=1 Tax=Glycomyces rhizosphaerae TaxID=2054422 RepID=A0ABV7PZ41_9ACTN
MELAERIRWCRDHLDPQDRLSWGHEVGDPREGDTLPWYPSELKSLGGLFDGLKTDLLEFYSYDRQVVKGRREVDPPTEVSLGLIAFSYIVSVEVKSLEVSIWDATDLETPEMWDEDDEPEPVFTVQGPTRFFDRYIFGAGYPELIDDILAVSPDPEERDGWRELLSRIS